MTDSELWTAFCKASKLPPSTPYEAWAFGGAPDQLAALVLEGTKTATASGYDLYALDDQEPMPRVGDYSVILDSKENALCVIRTTALAVLPFSQVGEDQAWKEGEGDRSLDYWRQVHWDFFTEEYRRCGLTFTENSPILCEEFELVYKP
ncbi:MAG: ASCH domain-containing protein [Faecousia sp.]